MSPPRHLPTRPNLEQLRKRAKDLLKAYRDGNPSALARFRDSAPRLRGLADARLMRLSLSLRDAQRVVAAEHGFPNWASARAYIERMESIAMFEMTVDHVKTNEPDGTRVVVLKGKEVSKRLPIWVGKAEGDMIAMKLDGKEMPRPMTHDLMVSMISDLGATVTRAIVSEMRGDTFFATVEIDSGAIERDCRPSDAIALAMRCGAPIFAEEAVLEQAGVEFDPKSEDLPLAESKTAEIDKFSDTDHRAFLHSSQ